MPRPADRPGHAAPEKWQRSVGDTGQRRAFRRGSTADCPNYIGFGPVGVVLPTGRPFTIATMLPFS